MLQKNTENPTSFPRRSREVATGIWQKLAHQHKNDQKGEGVVSGLEFIDWLLGHLRIKGIFDTNELKQIPTKGSFILVSNHPYGVLDSLLLLQLIGRVRPDFRMFHSLDRIKFAPVQSLFLQDQVVEKSSSEQSFLKALAQVTPIGMFPAVEAANPQLIQRIDSDHPWDSQKIKLIKKTDLPIIPVYIQSIGTPIRDLLSTLPFAPTFSPLPSSELFYRKNTDVKIRIGQILTPKEIKSFSSNQRLGRFLRAKTFSLGSSLKVKRFFRPNFKVLKKPKPIIDAIPISIIDREIEQLRDNDRLVHTHHQMEVFVAPAVEIPHILNEIGRLREITFREVGEGTNQRIDVDEFDLYYHHLFIWDRERQAIAGGYRMGKGQEIMTGYGKEGFYINTLFKTKTDFDKILIKSIELGRSFIVKEYQQKPLSLFLLWKGILYFLLKNPQYQYLLGPVSISNEYAPISKSLLAAFIKKYYYRHELAAMVQPKKRFEPELKDIDFESLLEKCQGNIIEFDKIFADVEPSRYRIPILLKKYIRVNARIIGFNIDPKFNDALDGLMLLDVNEVPQDMIAALKKEFRKLQEVQVA